MGFYWGSAEVCACRHLESASWEKKIREEGTEEEKKKQEQKRGERREVGDVMWNLTRTHQLALLLLLCTAIGPILLTRATFAQPLLDDFSEESWVVLSERTHEAPSLTCAYPHPGLLPSKVGPPSSHANISRGAIFTNFFIFLSSLSCHYPTVATSPNLRAVGPLDRRMWCAASSIPSPAPSP